MISIYVCYCYLDAIPLRNYMNVIVTLMLYSCVTSTLVIGRGILSKSLNP